MRERREPGRAEWARPPPRALGAKRAAGQHWRRLARATSGPTSGSGARGGGRQWRGRPLLVATMCRAAQSHPGAAGKRAAFAIATGRVQLRARLPWAPTPAALTVGHLAGLWPPRGSTRSGALATCSSWAPAVGASPSISSDHAAARRRDNLGFEGRGRILRRGRSRREQFTSHYA